MTNPKENTDLKEQIKQIIALTVHDSGVHEVEGLDWDSIDEAAEAIEKLVHQARVEARIDEIGKVQSEHGRYVTQTFINGQAMTVEERYNDLVKELESKEETNE